MSKKITKKQSSEAYKIIEQSVQAKLDADRRIMGSVQYQQREQIRAMIMSRPMGNLLDRRY